MTPADLLLELMSIWVGADGSLTPQAMDSRCCRWTLLLPAIEPILRCVVLPDAPLCAPWPIGGYTLNRRVLIEAAKSTWALGSEVVGAGAVPTEGAAPGSSPVAAAPRRILVGFEVFNDGDSPPLSETVLTSDSFPPTVCSAGKGTEGAELLAAAAASALEALYPSIIVGASCCVRSDDRSSCASPSPPPAEIDKLRDRGVSRAERARSRSAALFVVSRDPDLSSECSASGWGRSGREESMRDSTWA